MIQVEDGRPVGVQVIREFRLRLGRAIGLSLLLHALLLTAFFVIVPRPAPIPEDAAIPVQLVVSPPPEPLDERKPAAAAKQPPTDQPEQPQAPPLGAETAPATPEGPPAPSQPAPPPAAPKAAPGMTEAEHLYAGAILARPENRSAREALKTLSPAERKEQICDTEAMEQIHRSHPSLHPDRLIAYVLEDVAWDGDQFDANGAAFRSAHQWYALRYQCRFDPATGEVAAFRFEIGAAIPRERWSDLFLER